MIRNQLVILKADDVREDNPPFLDNWARFADIIREANVKAALGLIGDSLIAPSDAFLNSVVELSQDRRFEIWNHGFDHHLRRERNNGSAYSEFHNTSLDHQRHHLKETQRLAKERLGLTFTTFGAPGNHIDDNTWLAVDAIYDLIVWLYGDTRSTAHILERTSNIEQPTHYPNFEGFRNDYRADIPVLTLQLHPGGWDDDRFENFKSILRLLGDQDVGYINPTETLSEIVR